MNAHFFRNWKQITTVLMFSFFLTAFATAQSQCPANPSIRAAWYTTSASDVTALQSQGFNLFFYNTTAYALFSPSARDEAINKTIAALAQCSRLVLPIDNFLMQPYAEMKKFMETWGNNSKVYGFLLKDDVFTAPFPTANTYQPNALWMYRWFYRAIRGKENGNGADHTNDLAPGKRFIVTVPFIHRLPGATTEFKNNVTGINTPTGHKFEINGNYQTSFSEAAFLTPGESWDMVMPYWYPYKTNITNGTPAMTEVQIMSALHENMKAVFPSNSSVMPIIQTAAESLPSPLGYNYYLTPYYNLSIQYSDLRSKGLINSANKAVAYYSANGHSTVHSNLLKWQGNPTANNQNIYFREAGVLNGYHVFLFGQ